jgi:hypothetical protein
MGVGNGIHRGCAVKSSGVVRGYAPFTVFDPTKAMSAAGKMENNAHGTWTTQDT